MKTGSSIRKGTTLNIKKWVFFTALLFFCFGLRFTPAYGISLDELIKGIQGQYEKTKDLTADFEQETHVKMLERIRRAKGKVYLKKPGKMLWQYEGRHKKDIVINGDRMWVYDPFPNQVTITDLSKVPHSQIYMTFLTGMGDLRKDFRSAGEGIIITDEGHYRMRLIPKDPKSPLTNLTLLVNKNSFQIMASSFSGLQGDLTVIKYQNIRTNQKLSDSLFHFTIPEGTEVLHYPPKDER